MTGMREGWTFQNNPFCHLGEIQWVVRSVHPSAIFILVWVHIHIIGGEANDEV